MHLVVFALVLLSRLPLCAQDNPYPPGTFQLAPKVDLGLQPVELEIPAQFGDLPPITLNLPPGFSASVFAVTSRPGRARMMAFSPRGVLHLAHATRILALPDRDADGVADEVIEVASGLTWTNSIAFYKGDLYAAETDKIIRYRDADGDLVYEEQEIFIDTLPWAESAWHTSRAIAFDEINEKVYVAIGSPCDLCRSEKPFRAASLERLEPNPEWDAVLEFNTDGTGRRVFATGMRNVVGMDIHPITNELWGDHNGHDQEGAHLPPEWIDVIGDGDFQGYPFVYGYQVPMDFSIERYTDKDLLPLTRQDSLRIQTHQAPVALVEAHQAPLGIHFYRGDLFPPQYQNMAFVSLHGGMVEGNLSVVPGFKVIAVFSAPDGSNAKVADFLTGFGRGPERADVWGKPVGITTDAAGNMFVSSDSNNMVVLKITHSAVSGLWEHRLPEEIPVGSELSAAALVRLLRLAEGGGPPRVTANLETFGGPRALELGAEGDNAFRLDAALEVRGALGPRTISVLIEQDVGDVTHRMSLSRTIEVVSPVAGLWEHSLPAIIPVGSELDAEVLVRLLRLAENGDPPQVTADLQAFGGPAALELRAEGDRAFRLDTGLEVRGALGPRTISVLIEQYVFRGPYRTSLSQTIEVVPAIGGVWEHSLPDTVVRGSTLRVEALVRLQWLAENRPPPKVTVDLSPFGGPEELELEALGDQTYRLDTTLELAGRSGAHTLSILAQQDPILVEYQAVFSKTIAVLPGGDELILGDELAGGWQVEARGGALPPLLTADGPVFSGEKASAVQVDPTHFLIDWELDLKPVPPLDPFGFEALRFAVHPGDVRESKRASFVVSVGGFSVDLIRGEEEFRVDLTRPEWQVIEIPLSQFSVVYDNYATKGEEHVVAIEAIRLAGNLEGTFYLDDMRLVSSVTAPPAPTAVEEGADPVPEAFSLGQNFPNPFNSETAIRFALEARGEVELVIYNLSGQRVAVLVDDERAAGRYELRWDSRDDKGRALATGVYLFRLRVGTQVDTRKLLLLR